ncbi:MAG: glycosyltransferase [Planctomycetes bacterium]|nr:glycosyltransferase [Planctomycetota bacterium]
MRADRLRVLRVITRLNIGGPAREVGALCRLAAAHGVSTLLAAGRSAAREGDLFESLDTGSAAKVRVQGLERRLDPLADLRALCALARLIRRFRPQIVHTHLSKAGALGRMAAWTLGVPVICHTYHGHVLCGHFGAAASVGIRLVERILGRLSDAVIALGPAGARALSQLGIGRRVVIVPPGFDPAWLAGLARADREACRGELDVAGERPVLLALGRLARVKGLDLLLEAVAHLVRDGVRLRLLVAGDGPERPRLEARAARLGLAGVVRFLGWRTDTATLLAAADLLVLPSRSEGYPHAIVEARAAGLAVVATAVGEVPAMLAGDPSGFLVAAARVEALHERLAPLLADRDRIATWRAGRRPLPSAPAPTEAAMAARTCTLYRELLGGAARCAGGGAP